MSPCIFHRTHVGVVLPSENAASKLIFRKPWIRGCQQITMDPLFVHLPILLCGFVDWNCRIIPIWFGILSPYRVSFQTNPLKCYHQQVPHMFFDLSSEKLKGLLLPNTNWIHSTIWRCWNLSSLMLHSEFHQILLVTMHPNNKWYMENLDQSI